VGGLVHVLSLVSFPSLVFVAFTARAPSSAAFPNPLAGNKRSVASGNNTRMQTERLVMFQRPRRQRLSETIFVSITRICG
jgi:hypothetical protein